MATKEYSFQDDEETVIDIDIDMDIVVEKCTCIFFLK